MPGNIDITNGTSGTTAPTLISQITGLEGRLSGLDSKDGSQDSEISKNNTLAEGNSTSIGTLDGRVSSVETKAETNRSRLVEINEFVKNDGIPYTGVTNVPVGTTGTKGIVQADGVTIKSINGVLSADIAAARKTAVSSEALMLALPVIDNLYIVTRTDLNQLFYLNSTLDPAVLTNWVEGAYTGDIVASFNGRNGAVTPEPGDYEVGDIDGLVLALSSKQDELSATNRLSANAIGDGSVSNTELSFLGNVTSDIQDQIDNVGGFDEDLVYDQIKSKVLDVHLPSGDLAGSIEGLTSDTGLGGGAAPALSINLEDSVDFSIKSSTGEILRFDESSNLMRIGSGVIVDGHVYPSASGSLDLGASSLSYDNVYFQKLNYVPDSGSTGNLTLPLCIGMIKINSDATVAYRSSSNLSSSRDTGVSAIGAYKVSVSGTIKSALENANSYWYTVSGWDGDNVYTTNGWSTSGCGAFTRDMPGLDYQNTGVIVQIWIHDSSV